MHKQNGRCSGIVITNMSTSYMEKTVPGISLLFMLVVGALFFSIGKVSAAPASGAIEVIDRSHIKFDGREFFDRDINNNNDGFSSASTQCPGKTDSLHIIADSGGLKEHLNNLPNSIQRVEYRGSLAPAATGGDCPEDSQDFATSTLQNPTNFAAFFKVSDVGNIYSVTEENPSDSKHFEKNATDGLYYRVSEKSSNGNAACIDSISATKGSDSAQLTIRIHQSLIRREDGGTGPSNPDNYLDSWPINVDSYDGYYISVDLDSTDSSGCMILKPVDIKLANIANFSLAAGDGEVPGGGESAGDDVAGCESLGGAFSFILCPLLKIMDASFGWLDDRIVSALNINDSYYNTTGVKGAWANIRNIAYLLLIPTLLIMVISTALGFSFVDAYTVKRALPRLLVAIIFIALSFEITKLLVELSNVVGKGTAGIIAQPFGGMTNLQLDHLFKPSGANDVAFVGGAIVGGIIALLGPVTLWGIAITIGLAVLAMIIVFVILTVREMLIIFLMILAPLAILSWIFPGNDKMWKLWWGTFSKMLIFFPLIMALIVSGRAFASIVQQTGSDEGVVITTMIKLVAFISPYFFIPAAFKFAGGALGNLAGMVNNKSKGIFDRGRKLRGSLGAKKMKRIGEKNLFRGADEKSFKGRLNKYGQMAYMIPKAEGLPTPKNIRSALLEQKREEAKHLGEAVGLQGALANDDFSNTLGMERSKRRDFISKIKATNDNGDYLDEAGNIVDETKAAQKYDEAGVNRMLEQIDFLEAKYGIEGVKAQAFLASAGSKTSFRGGPTQMFAAAMRAADGDMDMAMTLYNQGRGRAEQAGRGDLAYYSFGSGQAAMQAMNNFVGTDAERQEFEQTINDNLLAEGLKSKSSGAIWSGHGTSVNNYAQAMKKKVLMAKRAHLDAVAAGEPADVIAKRKQQHMFALAELANANDQIAYFSPENADKLNTEIFSDFQAEVDEARDNADPDFRLRSRALSEQEKEERDRMRGRGGGAGGVPFMGGGAGGGSFT